MTNRTVASRLANRASGRSNRSVCALMKSTANSEILIKASFLHRVQVQSRVARRTG